MTIIFKAKTVDAYSIKIISELLQNNLKTACLKINKQGVFLRMHDPNRRILIDLALDADKFSIYKFRSKEKDLFLGLTLAHFHKMMKTIKKKDSLVLIIDSAQPDKLMIRVIPKENQKRISESSIKIQPTQNIETDLPEGYRRPINLTSSDFQKAVREIANISPNIKVTSRGFQIKFFCAGGGIYDKAIYFGETDDSDGDANSGPDSEEEEYEQNFESDQLTRITKISGLAADMQIFPKNNRPLLFKSSVGNLGKVAVYLKPKEMLEKEGESDEE